MGNFKTLRYLGYIILIIPLALSVMMVIAFYSYLSEPVNQIPTNTKVSKPDTVELVRQPIIINNPVVEKQTTTIVTTSEVVKPEPVKTEPVKPTIVNTPPVIDTTITKDSL